MIAIDFEGDTIKQESSARIVLNKISIEKKISKSNFLEIINILDDVSDDDKKEFFHHCILYGDQSIANALSSFKDGLLALYEEELVVLSLQTTADGSKRYIYSKLFEPETRNEDERIIEKKALSKYPVFKASRVHRLEISKTVQVLNLKNEDPKIQRDALISLSDRGNVQTIGYMENAKSFLHEDNKQAFEESIARLMVLYGNDQQKLDAVFILGETGTVRAIGSLEKALKALPENGDEGFRKAIITALDKADSYQNIVSFVKSTFSGLSLGSILILLALGLSVIFGLMGVINMAHGEFMMLGSFATYTVSQVFKMYLPPELFDWYYVVAIPFSFLFTGLIGYLCEIFLIKKLYGRPFETILATWGLSLILIQIVRIIFGDTLSLTPPSWLSGGVEFAPDLILPANRIFIVFYCIACVLLFYLVVHKTRLGLLLRATTQDRETANSLGVSVRKIDGLAFSIGTGLAGMAGCVVPLFDKINPGMGQTYIVDSFMVVVLGGVGKIAGVVLGGAGLGFVSKYIEPFIGAVYGKVIVLVLVVLFLQWKPSGLLPAKGRHVDD